MSVWAIVVAAGAGDRFGGPKQRMILAGRTVMDHAVQAAMTSCDGVVVVVPDGTSWETGGTVTVFGGVTRSDSVRAGLAAVPEDAAIVVVHDAARPLATTALFDAVIRAVQDGADGAVPGLTIADTVKQVGAGVVIATIPRETLVTVQTPQAFRASVLRGAHASGGEGTDDAALVETAGGRVVVVTGEPANLKITAPEDLARAALYSSQEATIT